MNIMLRTLHIIFILSLITIAACVWRCNDSDQTTPSPQDKLQFINTTNCDVLVEWNQIGTYKYENPTKENIRIKIGTDFKIPEEEQNNPQFVTRQEAIAGLSARYKIKSYAVNASRILDPSGFDSFSNTHRTVMQVGVGTTEIPLRSYLLQKINTCTSATGPGHEYKTYTDEIYAIDIPVVSCKQAKHYLKKLPFDGKLENVKEKTKRGEKIIRYQRGVYWPAIGEAKTKGANLDNSTVNIEFLTGELVGKLMALEYIKGIPFQWNHDFTQRVVKTVKTEGTFPLLSFPNSDIEIYQVMGECGQFKIYTNATLVKIFKPHITECRFNNVKIACPPESELIKIEKCQYREYFRRFSIDGQHIFRKHDRTSKLHVKFPVGVHWWDMTLKDQDLFQKNMSEILYKRITGLGATKTGLNLSTIARNDFEPMGMTHPFEQDFELDDIGSQFYQHIVKCDDYVIQTSKVWKKVANCKDGSTGPFMNCDFVPNLIFDDDEDEE